MEEQRETRKYSTYEIVRSGLIGLGAAVTAHRLEAAIRPSKRFAISELGIFVFTCFTFVHVADVALAHLHTDKDDSKQENSDLIKNFSEWLKKREKEEENAADIVESEEESDGEQ